jgi:hypothetical protein
MAFKVKKAIKKAIDNKSSFCYETNFTPHLFIGQKYSKIMDMILILFSVS